MNKNTYSTSDQNCNTSDDYYASLQADMLLEADLVERGLVPDEYGAGLSGVELLHEAGVNPLALKPKKPRAKAQPSHEIQALTDAAGSTLEGLTGIELQAGATARQNIERAKRYQSVPGLYADRVSVTRQRLGQRNALARVMQVQFHSDVVTILNDKSREYLDIMTALSANVAALSDTGWVQAQSWLHKNIPIVFALVGAVNVKAMFDSHLQNANQTLASKINMSRMDFMTGPRATEIAHRLEITTEQLRIARANTFGLTSIDPQSKKDRNRENMAARRREMGVKPQSERTKLSDLQAIADRIGKSLSTVRRHDKAGTLAEYLKAFDGMNKKCGVAKDSYEATDCVYSSENDQPIDIEQHFGDDDHAQHIGDDDAAFAFPWDGDEAGDWTLSLVQEGEAHEAPSHG
ncbi:hypothetical protein [Methylobacterium bullatum]|uniref:Uncharacterized protein n=1 Tax=Methylobacterium bullatum TaxID=570505 RepID=A0A679JXD1_9HYPH|nr:hypothetical protein MBLL_00682 [Methylobacterium bullatum]